MATSDRSKPAAAAPLDLLPLVKRSGIVSDRQLDDIRARVLNGEYPSDSRALADRLVREGVLTVYQANRFLNNKSHGLLVGGRYVILDRLGSGSMGRVYKAHHLLMGRLVALKIIAPEIVSNARVVARFQREMRLVGRLDHPHVVRAFDADQIDSVLFIVMEYVAGQSLAQRLRAKGPLPPAEVAHYAAQAALGLSHAHAQGIVHRDVKPSNLLLTEDRQIKVLDLGLGALMEADQETSFETADGIAVGTIDYMSPEQACGREVDGRSDLYSLGCAMYHLMTGILPFPGESPIERLGKRISGRPVPIADVLPDLPGRFVDVMDQLLAHKAHDRYQTAQEAAEALQSLTRRRSPARPAQPPPEFRPARPEPIEREQSGVRVADERAAALPEYPVWFTPLAALAERAPAAALLTLLGIGALLFGIGLALGILLF